MKETAVSEPVASPATTVQQLNVHQDEVLPLDAKSSLYYQPKLTVGSPDDPLEKEADDTADRVMRMPESLFIQRKCAHCEEEEKISKKVDSPSLIQRQEATKTATQSPPVLPAKPTFHLLNPADLQLRVPTLPRISLYPTGVSTVGVGSLSLTGSLSSPSTGGAIDWFAMNRPFWNRGAGQISYGDAREIEIHWNYSFQMFRSIGATPAHAIFFSNLLVPMAIDSSLQRDHATWWERTDRELNTSSKIISPTVLRFDLDNLFGTIRPFWDPSNPYQIQRKNKTGSPGIADASTVKLINSTRYQGSPIPKPTIGFMENRFGYDFSDVKIHHGRDAAEISKNLNAKAFTIGKDIYFNDDAFSPHTFEGKHLLAHELTHTLQQSGGNVKMKAAGEVAADWSRSHRKQSFLQCKLQQGNPSQIEAAASSATKLHQEPLQSPGDLTFVRRASPAIPDTREFNRSSVSQRNKDYNSFSKIDNGQFSFLQRKCSACEKEEKIQRKEDTHKVRFSSTSSERNRQDQPICIQQATSPVFVQRNAITSALGDAWDATGGRVVSVVGDAASAAIEWVEDKAEGIINRIAPGLLDFLRGNIVDNIKDLLARAVDAATGGLFSRLQAEGLQGVLEEFVSNLIDTITGGVEKGCEAFAILAQKILDFIHMLGGPALQRIKSFFQRIGGLLSSFWNNFALPIWDAIKSVAGTVWDWITSTAEWLWELIRPIRETIARAWNWLMRQFGIAWRAGGSVLDWIKGKAQQAWNWLVELIEPIKTPLMVIGGVLLMLSPLGPIVALGAGAYAIYRGVQWVKANWNREVFVRFRTFLKENVLDVISSGIESLKNSVVGAFSWLASTLLSLQAPIISLFESIGAIAIFKFIQRGIQSFANVLVRAVNWAGVRLAEIGRHIINVARDIWEFLRPYLEIAAKITFLALNPWLLPIVISAWVWRILPGCFKPPIINFVIGIMISLLRAMPNFKLFGDAWPVAKQNIITHLQTALNSEEEEKIRMSNRIAEMVSELDLELIGNQIEAVRQSPAYFDLELQSELLGINGTQILPFERANPLSDTVPAGWEGDFSSEVGDLLSRSTFSNSDVEVEQVGTLDLEPEVRQQLLANPNGEIIIDDQAHDQNRSIQAMLADLTFPEDVNASAEGSADSSVGGIPAIPEKPLSPEELAEHQLLEMIRNSDESTAVAACEETTQPDTGGQIPEEMKIGPLTERQRARYMRNQMWNSVKKWFRCNWHWVLPAVILAIIALIALEILTGGVVTIAFEVIGAIMMGVAAVKAAASLAKFSVNSFLGQIAEAARNFANAIAVLTIELVMALTFGLGDTIRSTQRGLQSAWRLVSGTGRAVGRGVSRGVRAAGRAGRALVRGELRQAGQILKTAAKGYVRRGRVVMTGVGRRFGAGYRNLKQLSRALYERLRFRRFKLRREGRMFQLWGEINPWVLLASGDIELIDQKDLRVVGAADETARLGDDVFVHGTRQKGIVIGVEKDPRVFVQELDPAFVSQNARKELSRDLRRLGNREARRAVIEMRESTDQLRKGIVGLQPANFQAHHVIPRELRTTFQDLFDRVFPKFDIEDGLRNGIMVPPDAATLANAIQANPAAAAKFGNSAFHLGSHRNYTLLIQSKLTVIERNLLSGSISPAQARTLIDDIVRDARNSISNGGGISINNLVF